MEQFNVIEFIKGACEMNVDLCNDFMIPAALSNKVYYQDLMEDGYEMTEALAKTRAELGLALAEGYARSNGYPIIRIRDHSVIIEANNQAPYQLGNTPDDLGSYYNGLIQLYPNAVFI